MKKQIDKKVGVIFFHKNITNLYKKEWIEKCVKSILEQTFGDFIIYEINYGGGAYSVIKDLNADKKHIFISEEFDNYPDAMNAIIDVAIKDGCDYIFNTNLDDFYALDRFEKQLPFLQAGYDIVSSDFCYIHEENGIDNIVLHKNILSFGDIKENINKNHNVIAHPVVGYSRNFIMHNKYDSSEIPKEDLVLWQQAINKGYKIYICKEELLNYRLHGNQVSGNNDNMALYKIQVTMPQCIPTTNDNKNIDTRKTPLRNLTIDF